VRMEGEYNTSFRASADKGVVYECRYCRAEFDKVADVQKHCQDVHRRNPKPQKGRGDGSVK
jgi:hypothetical protein